MRTIRMSAVLMHLGSKVPLKIVSWGPFPKDLVTLETAEHARKQKASRIRG